MTLAIFVNVSYLYANKAPLSITSTGPTQMLFYHLKSSTFPDSG
jgi:hypothetical protein